MRRSLVIFLVSACAVLSATAQPKFLWTRLGLGPTFDEARALAISPQGDLRVAGVFSDSVTIDGSVVQSVGGYDMFMARFSRTGQLLMDDSYGGLDFDDVRSIAVDNQGNFYLAGAFSYSAFVGEDVFADDEASSDIVLAKWNKLGIFQWSRVYGGKSYDESAPFVACDSVGNVYLAGAFGGSNVAFGTTRLSAAGLGDMFVAKINATTGDVIWAKQGGGIKNDEALTVSVSRSGDAIYVAGTFEGLGIWSGDRLESVNDKADFFIMCYDAAGAVKWLKKAGHPEVDRYISSCTNTNDDLLLTGAISGTTTFDGQTINANGENRSDAFVARITKSGTVNLLKQYGGTFTEIGYAIATDSRNNIYVAGAFDSLFTIEGNAYTSEGGLDAFVMRLRPDGSFEWIRTAGGPYDDEMRGIVLDKQNIPYVAGTFDTRLTIDGESQEGERYLDFFVGAIECGPNTALRPAATTMQVCLGGDSVITAPSGYPIYSWHVDGTAMADPKTNTFNMSSLTVGEHKIKVRITDQNDCSLFSKEVTVTVTEGMSKPVITQNGTTLTCNIDDARYMWYREGKLMSSVSTKDIVAPGNGTYRVRVTDSTGCTRWSDPVVIGTTSVDENDALSSIRVYPNPTSGEFVIDGLPLGASVYVADVLGRTVLQQDAANAMVMISLVDQPHGVYTLVIRARDSELTRLVVKR